MNEFDDMLKALDGSTMVTITDSEGKLLYVNRLFCEISKYSENELVGQKPHELLKSGLHSKEFYDNIWRTISEGKSWQGDVVNKAKDGSFFWTLTTIMPFLSEEGKPYKFIAIRKDITDRVTAENHLKKALEENEKQKQLIQQQVNELEEMDRMKEEFASMITHELKTPLVPIKGYCKMLIDPDMFGEINKDQTEAINEIYENADRLERLIADVLDAQKLDMKKMTFRKEKFDVAELMNKITKDSSVMMKDKQIEFVNYTDRNEIPMTSDGGRIRQVIENLIKNAVDFVPKEGGKIEIEAKKEDSGVTFYVKDNGIGIPEEKQKNLFKKFFQADTTQTRKHGGTGLGLAICKGLVEGLGGRIWFESKVGKGTNFYFSIPMEKP